MKHVYLFILLAGFLVAGCNSSTNKAKKEAQYNGHNARTSLDYKGTYEGTTPCADCEGIKTTLVLNDNTYTLTTQYLGKNEIDVFEEKGTYRWLDGSIIILEGPNGRDNETQYFIGENFVKMLDLNGNAITGEFADMYILKKK